MDRTNRVVAVGIASFGGVVIGMVWVMTLTIVVSIVVGMLANYPG